MTEEAGVGSPVTEAGVGSLSRPAFLTPEVKRSSFHSLSSLHSSGLVLGWISQRKPNLATDWDLVCSTLHAILIGALPTLVKKQEPDKSVSRRLPVLCPCAKP